MTARLLLVATVSLLVLTGCSALDETATSDSGAAYDEAAPPQADGDMPDDGVDDTDGGFAGAPAAGEAGGEEAGAPPLPAQVVARTGERIIKDGTMTVEVAEDGYLAAYRRVIDTALDLGGHLTDSTSTSTVDGGMSGSVTVRVPVERYEDLLTRVGQVGTLRRQDISSRDVTAEYTDLESRLRHLRAQETFYLDLLAEAEGVQDAIAVKQQLDGIQSQVEQLQGRLNVLQDRTSFSTLTVEIVEPGTEPVVAMSTTRPELSAYLQTARDGFVTVVGWLVVSVVSLAPLLVPLLVVAGVWRLARRREPQIATVSGDS